MTRCAIGCPLDHPMKCDLRHRAEACATWRVNQPDVVERRRRNDQKLADMARKKDRRSPIVHKDRVEQPAKVGPRGMPRFMTDAGVMSRLVAMGMV